MFTRKTRSLYGSPALNYKQRLTGAIVNAESESRELETG